MVVKKKSENLMKCRPTIVHLFALAFVHFVDNLGMKCKMWHRRLCICPIMTINDRKCRREGDVWLYKPHASLVHPSSPVKLELGSVLEPSGWSSCLESEAVSPEYQVTRCEQTAEMSCRFQQGGRHRGNRSHYAQML